MNESLLVKAVVVLLILSLGPGCRACDTLGQTLPAPRASSEPAASLRLDAFYVRRVRYEGFQTDHIHWIRFWPDGDAVIHNWPASYRGLPTAADTASSRGRRGRYVVVDDQIFMEFCVPDPDADRLVLRTSFAKFDRDGGFSIYQIQDNFGRRFQGRPKLLVPPSQYRLHVPKGG